MVKIFLVAREGRGQGDGGVDAAEDEAEAEVRGGGVSELVEIRQGGVEVDGGKVDCSGTHFRGGGCCFLWRWWLGCCIGSSGGEEKRWRTIEDCG